MRRSEWHPEIAYIAGLIIVFALAWPPAVSSAPNGVKDVTTDAPIDKAMQVARRPQIYFTVFNNGYGGDSMPHGELFEKLLKVITAEGHFNAVMCKYTEERETLCRKYKVLMLVDLLADGQHVYKNPKECKELCQKLRNNPSILAYHLWADKFGKTGTGRARDIDNVHQWDPTHSTYSGTYQSDGIRHLAKSDIISYYDFAWKRGIHKNFPNLLAAWSTATNFNSRLGRYVETDGGLAGAGNYNRALFIQNSSIACGLRGVMWFIGSRIMNMDTCQLNGLGKDVARVNAWFEPMWREIPKLGLPGAIYATPITKDFNNNPVMPGSDGKPVMAPGLSGHEFPADFWIKPISGEFVMGISKYADTSADAIYLASLNAYAEQNVQLTFARHCKTLLFDRETRTYKELPAGKSISLRLEPAGAALIRFEQK
ncbi:MAG: hypothetical protein WCN95_02175 [bacterium]